MKYALAVLCPPYALLDCGKPRQAALGMLLLAMAISGRNVGVVIGLYFLQILWAWSAVGYRDAHLEAEEFTHAIQLHQAVRRY